MVLGTGSVFSRGVGVLLPAGGTACHTAWLECLFCVKRSSLGWLVKHSCAPS